VKRRLVLVNPTLSNPFPGIPPLALGYIAALTPESWDVEIMDENFTEATFKECDLVGIGGFTAWANRAYQVARMFSKRGVPVVMGGIHASMMPDEALEHVDAVVVGEAESVWPEVIADVEAGRLKKRYEGVHTDLVGLVVPRRDLFDERYILDTVQTARGCPHDCDFCSVSQFNGFRYRQRPVNEVLDELATLENRYLFFVDDNIVAKGSGREDRALRLARGMVDRGYRFAWYSHAALNVADNDDVLRAFSESGCRLLFLGIEAEDREVLRSMNKKVNLKRDYETVFRKLHEHHIAVHGSLIFGTDEDTIEGLQRRLEFLVSSHIDVVQHCTLTPYPGTRLFDRLRDDDRLRFTDFPSDWDRYDLTEVMFRPHNLDLDEYDHMMRSIASTLYSRRASVGRFLRTLRDTRSIRTAIWCFMASRLYRVPRDRDPDHGSKYWYLDPEALPLIELYRKFEKVF
jgi:radical SAM superfamily enzyme YgiQ (UPF0313 family)